MPELCTYEITYQPPRGREASVLIEADTVVYGGNWIDWHLDGTLVFGVRRSAVLSVRNVSLVDMTPAPKVRDEGAQ